MRLVKDKTQYILQCMAVEMYKHKAYPSTKQIEMATGALVIKRPCLREKSSRTGCDDWKNSVRFKMEYYRKKLSQADKRDVCINAGKQSRSSPRAAPSQC